MADQLQLRGGTTAEHSTFTGALREVTVDTDKDTVVVHDGSTAGGHPLAKQNLGNVPAGTITSTMIADGTIVNADVNASAAIAGTKISPDFGSQTIQTTGVISHALGTAGAPTVTFTGDTNTGIYSPGADQVAISTNGTGRLFVDSSGRVGVGTASVGAKLHVVGGNAANCLIDNDGSQYTQLLLQHNGTANTGGDLLVDSSPGEPQLALRSLVGPLCFHTSSPAGSNAERARITADGKLGLGTSSPSYKFEVDNTGGGTATARLVGNDQSNVRLRIQNTGTGGRAYEIVGGLNGANNSHFSVYDATAAATRLTITDTGAVGIGTTSPSTLFQASGATAPILRVTDTRNTVNLDLQPANTEAYFGTQSNHPLAFQTNATERGRFDASGRFLVGTSTARGDNRLQVEGNADGAGIFLRRDVSAGALTTPGTYLGTINFGNTEGGIGAFIRGEADAAWSGSGSTDNPGRLVFSTTADGASSPTERMRITSGGNIAINCTGLTNDAPNVAGGLYTSTNGNIKMRVTSDGVSALQFYSPTGGTSAPVGSIVVNASSTSYSTTSDYRLKENIVPLTGATNRLNQLQVHRFNFIADPDKTVDGFIAHEAQAVVPECVTGTKDEVDADGNPVYQGIDQSKLVPLLTAALQEAIGRIEILEAEVAALKGA